MTLCQGCPQDVKSQDRDKTEMVNLQDRDETQTFNPQDRDVPFPKLSRPRRDRDVRFFRTLETETFNLQDGDETEMFQKTSRDHLETETFKTETTSRMTLR